MNEIKLETRSVLTIGICILSLEKTLANWEVDLIIGKDPRSAIVTIVERKTRFTLIIKLKSKKATEVANEFNNKLNSIYKKAVTYDNEIEMARD